MAIDCIARGRIPTAACSMPAAAQNRITRSCALSLVVDFAMALTAAAHCEGCRPNYDTLVWRLGQVGCLCLGNPTPFGRLSPARPVGLSLPRDAPNRLVVFVSAISQCRAALFD